MEEAARRPPRLAIGCNRADRADALRRDLEAGGIEVVAFGPICRAFLSGIVPGDADVLLVDLDDDIECDPLLLEALVERTAVPVLFNDGSTSPLGLGLSRGKWLARLMEKVRDVAAERTSQSLRTADVASTMPAGRQPALMTAATPSRGALPAERVWVLGASVGGPQAVKEFLGAMRASVEAGFILAQHIGERFIAPLANQLGRLTALEVVPARPGTALHRGQVVIAPVERALTIGRDKELALGAELPDSGYRPSIDAIMMQAAEQYGHEAGAIIFSGMGDDGARGCRAVAARGGVVWAQDADSCFISSMPDRARATGTVSFSARPSELARRLSETCHG